MFKNTSYLILLFALAVSCRNEPEQLSPMDISIIHDSTLNMMESIPKNLSTQGPIAWLNYFENGPDFFMVSEGRLVFPNNDSATKFIMDIAVKTVSKINLQWKDIRIDPLIKDFASIAANWHEEITDTAGKKTSNEGYFTATAHKTAAGWKLRSSHWSFLDPVIK